MKTTKRLRVPMQLTNSSIARFLKEKRGAAATEFAMLVPVLAVAFLMMVDIGEAIAAKYDVERKMRLAIEGVLRYGDDPTKVMAFANADGNTAFPGQADAPLNTSSLVIQPYYVCRGNDNSEVTYTSSLAATCPDVETWYDISSSGSFEAMFGTTFDLTTAVKMMAE